jgi:hypothetical protein
MRQASIISPHESFQDKFPSRGNHKELINDILEFVKYSCHILIDAPSNIPNSAISRFSFFFSLPLCLAVYICIYPLAFKIKR